MDIDKRRLHEVLVQMLSDEHHRLIRMAKDAAEAATHPENRQEGDKDMRATEASYVARGQAARVIDLEAELQRVRAMELLDFPEGRAIASSALVELESGDAARTYFMVPAGGGIRIDLDGTEIRTLATTSPLGASLLGLVSGDEVEVPTPSGPKLHEILSVS